MADPFSNRTLKRKNVKGLALNAPPARAPKPSDGDSQAPGALGNQDGTRTDTLEIGLEFQLDLKSEDLVVLKELGAGNGGTVSKVQHVTTKVVMARKIIRVDAKENVRKQILRELQVGQACRSEHVITYYGAFQNEARDIVLCMEYMDCGSLDTISRDFGPLRVDVLGKVTESILGGLVYLYEAHRIMHRDIKPSNVLVNSKGMIKLCDFGVATETVNSVANTFVGTSTYMAPERISGGIYSVKSDVWSVGLTVMEMAIGKFPFSSGDGEDHRDAGPMGILDLLQAIVHEPAPKLPKSDVFPAILDDFIAKCLLKNHNERPTPKQLYDHDAFLQAAKRTPVDLQGWTKSMMDKLNRRSYLAPAAPQTLKNDGANVESFPTPSTATAPRHNLPASVTSPGYGETPTQATTRFSQINLNPAGRGASPRSPPTLALQHLSLAIPDEMNGTRSHADRLGYDSRDDIPEPATAIETSRPMFPPRTSSSTSGAGPRAGNSMSMRPPPSGPLPQPPSKDLPRTPGYRDSTPLSPRRNR